MKVKQSQEIPHLMKSYPFEIAQNQCLMIEGTPDISIRASGRGVSLNGFQIKEEQTLLENLYIVSSVQRVTITLNTEMEKDSLMQRVFKTDFAIMKLLQQTISSLRSEKLPVLTIQSPSLLFTQTIGQFLTRLGADVMVADYSSIFLSPSLFYFSRIASSLPIVENLYIPRQKDELLRDAFIALEKRKPINSTVLLCHCGVEENFTGRQEVANIIQILESQKKEQWEYLDLNFVCTSSYFQSQFRECIQLPQKLMQKYATVNQRNLLKDYLYNYNMSLSPVSWSFGSDRLKVADNSSGRVRFQDIYSFSPSDYKNKYALLVENDKIIGICHIQGSSEGNMVVALVPGKWAQNSKLDVVLTEVQYEP